MKQYVIAVAVMASAMAVADDGWQAQVADELAMARQGQLADAGPVWLRPWELPDEVRREFQPPEFSVQVRDGDDPYVMVDGRVARPGERAGDYPILAIEPEGVVLEVDGYAVLVD